jgi:hypothetical protein
VRYNIYIYMTFGGKGLNQTVFVLDDELTATRKHKFHSWHTNFFFWGGGGGGGG